MHLQPHIGGDEPDTGQHRQDEQRRDQALGPLRPVQVGRLGREPALRSAVFLRRRLQQGPGPGGRGGADHPPRGARLGEFLSAVTGRELLAAALHLAHASRRFIVIQIATNTSAAIPPRKATSPSVTGPTRPRLNPPGFGSERTVVMYAMMARFWAGVMVVSLNTGMASGPVSIAS